MPKTSEKKPSRLVRVSEDNYGWLLSLLSERQKGANKIISMTEVTNEELDKSRNSHATIN